MVSPGLIDLLHSFRGGRQPFPAEWEAILLERFRPYGRLPADDLAALRGRIRGFLDRTAFEGCNGQEITDEVRIVIAAYACLLALHLPRNVYHSLGSVLVYPTSFAAPVRDTDPHGIVTEALEERLGESWGIGTIVLAWDRLVEPGAWRGDGLNVVLHEFAHLFDAEAGISEGAPLHQPGDGCRDWAELCRVEYARCRANRRRGRPRVLDPYGAANPAECFAVASETFFERPIRLKAHHPALYAELQAIYGQDPAAWRFWRVAGAVSGGASPRGA